MSIVSDERPFSPGHEAHFGLVESPFTATPDPRFLFESRSLADTLEQVVSAIRLHEPLVVVTGEEGTGKTMLCRALPERLAPPTFLSIVTDPSLTPHALVKQILIDFGALPNDTDLDEAGLEDLRDLIEALRQFLASSMPPKAHAVVVIDDAQHLQVDALKCLRLLSAIDNHGRSLLQIVLVGRVTLEHVVSQPAMRDLEQQVRRRVQLTPLKREEIQPYIERRLWVAHGGSAEWLGRSETTSDRSHHDVDGRRFWQVRFTPSAVRAIAELSGGVPRAINVICERSLEVGARNHPHRIDVAAVLSAARQLQVRIPVARRVQSSRHLHIAVALLAVVGLSWWGVHADAERSSQSAGANTALDSTAGEDGASDMLSRARELAELPDVRGLVSLRSEWLRHRGWSERDALSEKGRADRALRLLDQYLGEARRRQLDIDAHRLRESQLAGYR